MIMTTVLTCHPSQPVPEKALAAIKARQQVVWSAGDFAVIGTTLQIVGEQLCESLDLRSTERVLDVAAPATATRRSQRPAASPR
jgi:hypothetical protein